MASRPRCAPIARPVVALLLAVGLAATLAACGSASGPASATTRSQTSSTAATTPLPGAGRPVVQVGDKNYTEQFILGELYYFALQAQGFPVTINRNIGTTQVTMRALTAGTLSFYPEYIGTWDRVQAGDRRHFASAAAAYRAGQTFALAHGYSLLNPSPFSDTQALAVDFNYGLHHGLSSIGDLRKVQSTLTLGGPPQFQTDPAGLPAVERAYHVKPAAFQPLEIGGQYQALTQGTVQAASVNSTDGQLITGNETLLRDPAKVFGFGNVVPVVPIRVLQAEGPAFAATINRVTALLSTSAIRQMNAAVDVDDQDPAKVALAFLAAHRLAPPSSSPS